MDHLLPDSASAHADDVRTLTSSLPCLTQQVNLVQEFASRNGLLLNIQKCEVMAASSTCNTGSVLCSIGSNDLKSLGFWWSWDLSAKVAIDEAVKKARRAFLCTVPRCSKAYLVLYLVEPCLKRALFQFFFTDVRTGS